MGRWHPTRHRRRRHGERRDRRHPARFDNWWYDTEVLRSWIHHQRLAFDNVLYPPNARGDFNRYTAYPAAWHPYFRRFWFEHDHDGPRMSSR